MWKLKKESGIHRCYLKEFSAPLNLNYGPLQSDCRKLRKSKTELVSHIVAINCFSTRRKLRWYLIAPFKLILINILFSAARQYASKINFQIYLPLDLSCSVSRYHLPRKPFLFVRFDDAISKQNLSSNRANLVKILKYYRAMRQTLSWLSKRSITKKEREILKKEKKDAFFSIKK